MPIKATDLQLLGILFLQGIGVLHIWLGYVCGLCLFANIWVKSFEIRHDLSVFTEIVLPQSRYLEPDIGFFPGSMAISQSMGNIRDKYKYWCISKQVKG